MNKSQRITISEERKELILPIIGLTFSEKKFFEEIGFKMLRYDTNGKKTYFNYIGNGFDLELSEFFPGFKKILIVKNPYWSILETYFKENCYIWSNERKHFNFKQSVEQDIIEVNYPRNLDQFDEFFIIENYKTEFDRVFNLNHHEEVQHSERFMTKISNYHASQNTLSDFYDNETAEIVYNKFNQYFVKFGYDQYSYLDFYNSSEKIHVLHGKPTNIFHI